ncbi:sensor domain-containing protein [[Mycobacterium] nativiensis]|uniref:Sensor domain-containing protein n=1 Tax=[Mycobacterium] nativiensis TaxID=2855503 RepID=A0ABU5Y5L0_9MYCO|nr:sensor domain-containing protein [Mycolicibacter sp. MYC340]MEB3034250.1 sensor domain-containing protein [Mycolicibacter sp. MYC340]
MKTLRLAAVCAAVSAVLGCTRLVGGTALPPITPPAADGTVSAARIMLDTPRLRAIVGAGEELTIIPTMESSAPVDIDELAATVPPPCRFIYAETAVVGSGFSQFRKTTYQYPPKPGLISEGATVYPDPESARGAFDNLVGTVAECADSPAGPGLVGDWTADEQSLHTRAGACGRSYRVKSVVLLEVTHCGFSESIADLVLVNMAAGIPG